MAHRSDRNKGLSPGEIEKMLQKMQAYQVELETQNEELRRTQLELTAARARYFDLFNVAPVGYCIISPKGLILEANLKAASLMGVAREELINQPFTRFLLEEDQEIYHLHRRQNDETGEPQACELRMLKPDGTVRWVHVTSSTSLQKGGLSGYHLVIVDMTTRKQIEEALYKREAQYRQIIETAREGIGITDANWRMTFVNNHMAELLGYESKEMVGRSVEDFLSPKDKAGYTLRMREREQGRDGQYESRFCCKNGGEIWATVSATARMDKEGRFEGSFFMITDNTRRKAAEASSRAKSDFLALVSHEIRTPLNALVGFSALARKTSEPAVLQQYLDIIDQSAWSLMDLVNDILDMSKIEAEQLRLENIPFNLADTIDLLVWQYTPLASQKRLDFQVSRASDLPAWINGDPLRLRQILANLITNAIKFTETGRITLTVAIAAPAQGENHLLVRFTVRDSGIGIAPENLSFLFQPFWQIDPSITRKYGGTGLGLAVVQRLVKLMKGRIEVASKEGRGSCFVVELPFAMGAPPVPENAVPPIAAVLDILVVEDDDFSRLFLADVLTLWGHRVTQAGNAIQALELARQHPYDLIILDIRMPDMDGIELTNRLRTWEKEHNGRPVPIIACTGDTEKATQEQCLAAGMMEVLPKPIDLDELARALTGQVRPPKARPVNVPSFPFADRVLVDMGFDVERTKEYLQLLRDDIHGELDRLDQALLTLDRKALKAAAHTLKGLCGHLRDKFPRELALELHEAAYTGSQELLHDMVIQLRSTCIQLFAEN